MTSATYTLEPRGLTREQAASYVGLTVAGFDDWVRRNILPKPIPDTHRWDRKAIDLALDKRSGLETTMPSALDQWRAGRNVREP